MAVILILLCLLGAWGAYYVARDTVGEASAVPISILSFTLLLFATGAV